MMSIAQKMITGVLRFALCLAVCLAAPAAAAADGAPTIALFQGGDGCWDREANPTAAVDTHLHFRPFGGPVIPFGEMVGHLRRAGVLFANVYGIGQSLPSGSDCAYYLDCPGELVRPSLRNDFANAAYLVAHRPQDVVLTLSMTFPNLADPLSVWRGMDLLDLEFPGEFRWMGEVNLVKQALFNNGHAPVPISVIAEWAPFMHRLRTMSAPIAIHSDMGSDADPTAYMPWLLEVLRLYPENSIVWMHLGLSRELTQVDAPQHVALLEQLLDDHPNLSMDISWGVLEDAVFSDPAKRPLYVDLLNRRSDRFLPGTDFVAEGQRAYADYHKELQATSRILRHLSDAAFRDVALGGSYFKLLGLPYEPPPVCAAAPDPA